MKKSCKVRTGSCCKEWRKGSRQW